MREPVGGTKFVKRDDEFWRNVDEVSKKVRANPEIYGDHRRPKIMESKDDPVGGTEQKGTCDLDMTSRCQFSYEPHPKSDRCLHWQPLPAQSPTEPKYTNRHGDPCSQACGEGRHQDCTETYQTCHCTYRGLHKTMHAYLSSPVAQSPVPAGPYDAANSCSNCGASNPDYVHPCGQKFCWHCEDNRGRHDDCAICQSLAAASSGVPAGRQSWCPECEIVAPEGHMDGHERIEFEKWLGEETCEVHWDESANKNAWFGWQERASRMNKAAECQCDIPNAGLPLTGEGRCSVCSGQILAPEQPRQYSGVSAGEGTKLEDVGFDEATESRWQIAIYRLCKETVGPENDHLIDGGGCDSGAALDVTLSEISQAINFVRDNPAPTSVEAARETPNWPEAAAREINLSLPVNGVLDQGIIETLGVSEAAVIFEERLAGIIRRAYANSRQPAARADVTSPEFYSKRGPQCPTCGNFRDMPHTCTDSFHAARETCGNKFTGASGRKIFTCVLPKDHVGDCDDALNRANLAAREPMTAEQFMATLSADAIRLMSRCEFAEAYLANYREGR